MAAKEVRFHDNARERIVTGSRITVTMNTAIAQILRATADNLVRISQGSYTQSV